MRNLPANHRNETFKKLVCNGNCFISEKTKLCYVSVQKAASSSIRWWLLELEGIAEHIRNKLATQNATTKKHTLYSIVKHTSPDIVFHNYAKIENIFSSNDYFCFSVVRNPYKRIFSAWSEKMLCDKHEPNMDYFRDSDFYYHPVATIENILDNFEDMLVYLKKDPRSLMCERHWMVQHEMLRPDLLPYDLIATLESPAPLSLALERHLGFAASPLTVGHHNKSMLSYRPEFISEKAKSLIQDIYAADFASFGYDTALPQTEKPFDPKEVENTLLEILKDRVSRATRAKTRMFHTIRELKKDNTLLAAGKKVFGSIRQAFFR